MDIELRPATEAEYHQFFREYRNDPKVDPHPFVYSSEMVSRSYHYNYDGIQNGYAHFGIMADRRMIGCFQLKRMDPERKKGEFGIILQNDACKGKGFGTRAVLLGMKAARDLYGLKTLSADTMSINIPMRRIFEKLGFTLTETVPEAFTLPDGSKADRLVYEADLENITEGVQQQWQQQS